MNLIRGTFWKSCAAKHNFDFLTPVSDTRAQLEWAHLHQYQSARGVIGWRAVDAMRRGEANSDPDCTVLVQLVPIITRRRAFVLTSGFGFWGKHLKTPVDQLEMSAPRPGAARLQAVYLAGFGLMWPSCSQHLKICTYVSSCWMKTVQNLHVIMVYILFWL